MKAEMQDDLATDMAWLNQMLAQIHNHKPWTMHESDPVGRLYALEDKRPAIEAEGLRVPPIVSAKVDPLGAMLQWRDFLASILTVH